MVTAKVIDIPVQLAKDFIGKNPENRKPYPKRISLYSEDMMSGQWSVNGETIKFNENGQLIDGQHRLLAAIKADFTLKDVVVVKGLPVNAFHTIDSGKNRTLADALHIAGYLIPGKLSTAIRAVEEYEKAKILHRRDTNKMPIKTSLEYAENHSDRMYDYIKLARNVVKTSERVIAEKTLIKALHITTGGNTVRPIHEAFIKELCGATTMRENNACNKFLKQHRIWKRNDIIVSRYGILGQIIKCWNSFVNNDPVISRTLTFDPKQKLPKVDKPLSFEAPTY